MSMPPPPPPSVPAQQPAFKPVYDNKSQYERVAAQLLAGEQLYVVFDLKGAGSGFLGVTDRRLIFVDQNFLDRKDAALVSVPFSRISYVAVQTERHMLARDESSVTVAVTGRTFEFEFRGVQKAHYVNGLILSRICG